MREVMLSGLSDQLACPACGEALRGDGGGVVCLGCGAEFASCDIPVLTHDMSDPDMQAQVEFYDHHADEAHESLRPWDRPRFHGWLIEEKFRQAIEPLAERFGDRPSALVVCGGSGLDAELLSRHGFDVTTSDVSVGASRRARARAQRRGTPYLAIVADAERLPFRDQSVDLVFVHDGLHHLPDPASGVREMLRVARFAVAITEPTPSLATTLAIRVGVSDEVEDAGNVVRRLPLSELTEFAVSAGFEILRARRYGMFYRDGTGIFTRVLSAPGVFPLARVLTRALMRVSAPIGNKLVLVAARKGAR